MHAIAALATAQLRDTPNGIVLDDRGIDVIVAALEKAFAADEAFVAAGALMAAATTWLTKPDLGIAARTLLALLLALHPVLSRIDARRAADLKTDAEAAAARFAAFTGPSGNAAEKVLDAGAPAPAGTTRANPLARFALLGQTPPKKPPT
jgi:hypothetical protein